MSGNRGDPVTSDRAIPLERGETVYLVFERPRQIMVLLFHDRSIDRFRLHGPRVSLRSVLVIPVDKDDKSPEMQREIATIRFEPRFRDTSPVIHELKLQQSRRFTWYFSWLDPFVERKERREIIRSNRITIVTKSRNRDFYSILTPIWEYSGQ